MKSFLLLILFTTAAYGDDAVIEAANAQKSGEVWSFSVTLSHGDTGWDDYADGWRVVDAGGKVLGTRVLHHPHVDEQPFTRSLGGVSLPEAMDRVYIEARTNTDGWGAARFEVSLK